MGTLWRWNMNRIAKASCIILACSLAVCSSPVKKAVIDPSLPHLSVTLTFNADAYNSILLKKIYPTYAIWVRDPASGETRTIYVTGKAGKNSWMFADERPSAAPVWSGTGGRAADVDSVTSATPSGETFTHEWQVPEALRGKKLEIFIEANIAFDYNEHFPKDAPKDSPAFSDVNGQPSLVWRARIEDASKDAAVTPALIGHGHVLGKDHEIDADLSRITTAKNIFGYVKLAYSAGGKK